MMKFKKIWKGARKGVSNAQNWVLSKPMVMAFMLGFYSVAAKAGDGTEGFNAASQMIKNYKTPVQTLLYSIAIVISLVGAFNIYFKMQNGDQDVKKTIMMTIGGCVAFIAAATALPAFFE